MGTTVQVDGGTDLTLSLEELSARIEINELLVRYAHCIDTGDFDGLDDVFTADAFIDCSAFDGAAGGLEEIKRFLNEAMPMFKSFQHMIGNTMLEFVDHDTVHGRTICHNPMVFDGEGPDRVMVCGLWYVDEFVRTDAGWRIARRVEERSFMDLPPSD